MTESATPTRVVVRLSKEEYQHLEKLLPPANVSLSGANDAGSMGYKLGVQAVLKVLRDGFVIGGY